MLAQHLIFRLLSLLVLIIASLSTQAQTDTLPTTDTLQVGVKVAPPFAMKNKRGEWTGISIYLWRVLAKELDYEYQFVEYNLEDLLYNVKEGNLDAGIAAITISKEREEYFDFSLPYFTTGFSIATPKEERSSLDVIKRFFSLQFFKAVGALVILLVVIGVLLWLVERKKNPEQFGGSALHGIGSAFWWSAVTMTTVGYGDKAPVTPLGRVIGFAWMFAGIIIISGFTAAITSALTVDRLETKIQGPDDLHDAKVGTVRGSSSANYLASKEIEYLPYDKIAEVITALNAGELDAVVYDAPILQYLLRQGKHDHLELLPGVFQPFHYGIALPESSFRIEKINVSLLDITTRSEWKKVLFEYLGTSDH
jgi:ABC-type amino acid transport substrate-binding protein